jgi:hypothetical protein
MIDKEELARKFKEKYNRNPIKLLPQQIEKIEYAYRHGANERETYIYAGLCKTDYYYWKELNPEYAERKAQLKELIKFNARENIMKSIEDGDASSSKWLLERWNKDEFSLRVENTGKDGKDLIPDKIIRDDIKGDKDGK